MLKFFRPRHPRPTLAAQVVAMVGKPFVLEGPSPHTPFGAVFEDDGDTGYFYGLDRTDPENPILDAMHIYNSQGVTDRHLPCTFQIVWSGDGLKVGLFINDYAHAVLDFDARRGYCRSNFAFPTASFGSGSHEWSDATLALFQ